LELLAGNLSYSEKTAPKVYERISKKPKQKKKTKGGRWERDD